MQNKSGYSAINIVKELKNVGGGYDDKGIPTSNGVCGIETYLRNVLVSKKLQSMSPKDLQNVYIAFERRFPGYIRCFNSDKRPKTNIEKEEIFKECKMKNDTKMSEKAYNDISRGHLRLIGVFYDELNQYKDPVQYNESLQKAKLSLIQQIDNEVGSLSNEQLRQVLEMIKNFQQLNQPKAEQNQQLGHQEFNEVRQNGSSLNNNMFASNQTTTNHTTNIKYSQVKKLRGKLAPLNLRNGNSQKQAGGGFSK